MQNKYIKSFLNKNNLLQQIIRVVQEHQMITIDEVVAKLHEKGIEIKRKTVVSYFANYPFFKGGYYTIDKEKFSDFLQKKQRMTSYKSIYGFTCDEICKILHIDFKELQKLHKEEVLKILIEDKVLDP